MKKIEVDVIVVGGGSAGLSAAVTAAEKGADVAVFHKEATLGGNGNRGMGMFAVESRIQKEQNVTLTREEAFREMMAYSHWQTDTRLTRAFIGRSAETIEWLLGMGVKFGRLFSYFPTAHPTEHDPVPPEKPRFEGFGVGTMGGVMEALDNRAAELGVRRYLETPVEKLVKDGSRVCGILSRDKSGREIEAGARAVIIATGGFGENREWVKKYTGFDLNENMFVVGKGGVMGEGIRMAWDAGADSEGMIMQMINVIIAPGGQPIPIGHPLFNRSYDLLVNLDGQRFMTEEEMKMPTYFGNQLARQKGACGVSIIDGAIAEHFKSSFDPGELFGPFKLDFEPLIEQFEKAGSQAYCRADSLEELADKTGIDPEGLHQTVAEYNADCTAGKDSLFYKNREDIIPLTRSPYFASRFVPGAFGTLGGIKINHRIEVLDKNQEVIPGLYAAGVDANNLYRDSYEFYLCAGTMGFAINSGRIAGENAAQYARSMD
jgi:fumarate reductase flavoprotein subunit